jgi:branched-chain amino acid transport system substrate-binding protein
VRYRSAFKRIVVVLSMFALAACGGSSTGSSGPAAKTASDVGITKDQILLGGTIALSGPAAAYGTIDKAADAYFQYVNGNGGVNGRKIKFDYRDDGYNPAQTVPITKELVEGSNPVFAMFGGLGTQAQVSVEPYLNAKKVPQVFVATGATQFSAEVQKYPYTFGWQPAYQGEAYIYAQALLKTSPPPKVAVIYQNDDYGQDYLNGLKKGLGSKASTIILKTQANEVGAPDVKSQIATLKASGADTLMIFETPSPAIKSLATAAALGWHPTIYLNSVGASVPYLLAAQKATGSAATVDGVITVNYVKDALDPANASDPGVVLFKHVLQQGYPEGKTTDTFNMYGMAVAYTMVDVLKHSGDNPTRQSLRDALNNFSESDNPFLAKGIKAHNTASDHYTITQEALYKYDAAAVRYTQQGDILDFRGKVVFP